MALMAWNIRGFDKVRKKRELLRIVVEKRMGIIGVLVTKSRKQIRIVHQTTSMNVGTDIPTFRH